MKKQIENNLEEKQLKSKVVFDGNLLHVKSDTILLPNGKESTREYIEHVGAACIVAITDKNEIIVEKQYRYPFHRVITEIPAGKLNFKDEDPLLAAKRELKEETGYTAKTWHYLGTYYPSCAYSDEKIAIYLARDLETGNQNLDDDEFLQVELIPFQEFLNDIFSGKICDGKTQSAVLLAHNFMKQDPQ